MTHQNKLTSNQSIFVSCGTFANAIPVCKSTENKTKTMLTVKTLTIIYKEIYPTL